MRGLVKHSRVGLLSVVLALSLIVVPTTICLVGCASQKAEQTAYKTLYVVGSTANTSVDTWLKYYLLESYNTSKQPASTTTSNRLAELNKQDKQVQALYTDFQKSYNAALMAAQLNVTNMSPAEVSAMCGQLAALITNFTTR